MDNEIGELGIPQFDAPITANSSEGVHPKVVQEKLGHSKMSTTMDLYSLVMPSMQKDAVLKFERAMETPK